MLSSSKLECSALMPECSTGDDDVAGNGQLMSVQVQCSGFDNEIAVDVQVMVQRHRAGVVSIQMQVADWFIEIEIEFYISSACAVKYKRVPGIWS